MDYMTTMSVVIKWQPVNDHHQQQVEKCVQFLPQSCPLDKEAQTQHLPQGATLAEKLSSPKRRCCRQPISSTTPRSTSEDTKEEEEEEDITLQGLVNTSQKDCRGL